MKLKIVVLPHVKSDIYGGQKREFFFVPYNAPMDVNYLILIFIIIWVIGLQ